MKIILLILIGTLLFSSPSQAQFGKDLLNQVKRKAKDKVSQKADQSVDKAADKAEDAISKKDKKKKEKNSTSVDETVSSSSTTTEETNSESIESKPASSTQITAEGTPFVNKKLILNTIVFNEKTSEFNPNPNPILNGVGATIQQKIKKEKILIKVYQRSTGDNATNAEEEYMAIKMYLVNRFDLNEDRIYFSTPATKKAGINRTIEFILVPDSFMFDDATKY